LNLFSNAIKFTDRKGKIVIMNEYDNSKNMLIVSIVDSGLGIKKKNKGKLFKLFGSIKDEKRNLNMKGIGLGLVICKLIVEKFDGKIDFISTYKKGTTFYFTF
jgi:signal transduction histidine kinase